MQMQKSFLVSVINNKLLIHRYNNKPDIKEISNLSGELTVITIPFEGQKYIPLLVRSPERQRLLTCTFQTIWYHLAGLYVQFELQCGMTWQKGCSYMCFHFLDFFRSGLSISLALSKARSSWSIFMVTEAMFCKGKTIGKTLNRLKMCKKFYSFVVALISYHLAFENSSGDSVAWYFLVQ